MVNATAPSRITPGKDLVPIVKEVGWAPGPLWTDAENVAPTGVRSQDSPVRVAISFPVGAIGIFQ